MGDARTRGFERRARAGDPEAAARLLRERVRQGELTQANVELAAFLGDRASRTALGDEALDAPRQVGPLVSQLGAWGAEWSVRAVVALARRGRGAPARARSVLAALEAFAAEPSPATRAAVTSAAAGLREDEDVSAARLAALGVKLVTGARHLSAHAFAHALRGAPGGATAVREALLPRALAGAPARGELFAKRGAPRLARPADGDGEGAAALRARVDRRELAPERLAVAASLGHRGALAAVDRVEPIAPAQGAVMRQVAGWDEPSLVRAAVVAVREAARRAPPASAAQRRSVDAVLKALVAWSDAPGKRTLDALMRRRASLDALDEDDLLGWALGRAMCAATADGRDAARYALEAITHAIHALLDAGVEEARPLLWVAIQAELVPWALAPARAAGTPARASTSGARERGPGARREAHARRARTRGS